MASHGIDKQTNSLFPLPDCYSNVLSKHTPVLYRYHYAALALNKYPCNWAFVLHTTAQLIGDAFSPSVRTR